MMKKITQFFATMPHPDSLYSLGLMRVLVSGALLGLYIWRQLEVNFYFTDKDSIIQRSQASQLFGEFYRTPFSFFIWHESLIPLVHFILILCLLLLFLGIGNRLLTFATWFICLGFFQRNLYVAYGADMVGSLWLFYLSWTQHNVRWSILNYFKPDRIAKIKPDLLTTAGYRMIQLQICVVYGYTGMQKLKGMSWWDGTSLWTVLGSSQMAIFDFRWLTQFPIVIAVLVFATLVFEIYFPILVWIPKLRKPILFFGFLFHSGIAISMGIWSFSTIMISSYMLFLTGIEDQISLVKEKILVLFKKKEAVVHFAKG